MCNGLSQIDGTDFYNLVCRISGFGKTLEVRTLGCAQRSPPPSLACSLRMISRPSLTNPKNMRHKIYTGSGHRYGVIPYSSVVWWIASWAEDEKYKGKNNLLRRGVLVLGQLVVVRISSLFLLPLLLCYGGG